MSDALNVWVAGSLYRSNETLLFELIAIRAARGECK